MYESPITMYMSDINKEIQKQTEEESMIVINQTIGFDVDKEELLKALQYDREQYEKGYRDCKNDILDKVKQAREEMHDLDYLINDAKYSDQETRAYNVDMLVTEFYEIMDKLIAESEGTNG